MQRSVPSLKAPISRVVSGLLALSLYLGATHAQACEIRFVECIYENGRFAPFKIEFDTETSAGGVKINVGMSQQLEDTWAGDEWQFKTKLTGFVYGLYGSITDTSEFTVLLDNSYRTQKFSRTAKVYGMFPVAPTSFKQSIDWERDWREAEVRSKYKGEWYEYPIEAGVLDQAIIPLQLRRDLIAGGPDIGTVVYTATSKKRVDDDFMFRFVKLADIDTPLGTIPTAVYELLKGEHKAMRDALKAGHDLGEMERLVDRMIQLRQGRESNEQEEELATIREQLNALLRVDKDTIVSISDEEARSSAGRGNKEDGSLVDKASEIEEGNARVFFWFSTRHAYLPVKLMAVIDGNSWSKAVITEARFNGVKQDSLQAP